jgi:hypothetical protein
MAILDSPMDLFFLFFLRYSMIFHADRRNNSIRCFFRRFSRLQDVGTPYNSTWCTCHLVGHPRKYHPGPTGMFNEARGRFPRIIFSNSSSSTYPSRTPIICSINNPHFAFDQLLTVSRETRARLALSQYVSCVMCLRERY